MTVIVPENYHAKQILESNRVTCISKMDAFRQDIRPLRIGMLNIMPMCQDYEFNLLHPLGLSIIQVEPVWIRLESHKYKTSNQSHIDDLYVTYEEALKKGGLDGLIVTGAPVEKMNFDDVRYWDEIRTILEDAKFQFPSTLGLCWAALALAKLEGIDKFNYTQKLFGVYEIFNLDHQHPITGELDDVFWCPQSRQAGIADEQFEEAQRDNVVRGLAHSKECGYVIFETPDHRYVMHDGHPEYSARRLVYEVQRDKDNPDVEAPVNFDIHRPFNRWRSHRNLFFTQWLKYCYQKISFK